MKEKLTANLGLKLLALFFAIAIWFIVININDPVDRTVFRNVPVEILNTDSIIEAGKVYEVLDGTNSIDVTVWAKRSILDSLRKDNIIATADMEEINFSDTMVKIKLVSNRYNDRIESLIPSIEHMNIRVENLETKQLYITTATIGEPSSGHILGNVSTQQNLIRVSGPESSISRISGADVTVDVSELTRDIRSDIPVVLRDEKNNPIIDDSIVKSLDRVAVSVEILKVKTVPVHALVTGNPLDGYSISGDVSITPRNIRIAGSEQALAGVNEIVIPDGAIVVTGQSADVKTIVDISGYMPTGVRLADRGYNGEVTLITHIEKNIVGQVAINKEDVEFTNVPEGFNFSLASDKLYVRITGLRAEVDMITSRRVKAKVDIASYMRSRSLEKLSEGEYNMPFQMEYTENVRQDLSSQALIKVEPEG